MTSTFSQTQRVLIMGAAGRDFHNFNVFFRDNPRYQVVAFTATQIPDIEGRLYPPELAGELYPQGIPIHAEAELDQLIRELTVDQVVFAYSDVSHEYVMHKASQVLAAGADFRLMGAEAHHAASSSKPVVAICAVRTGSGKSQTTRRVCEILRGAGQAGRGRPPPHALRRPGRAGRAALRQLRGPGPPPLHHRGARGVRAAHRPRRDRLRRRGLRGDPAPGRAGGRRHRLGRRQQRPALLPARPAHRGGRPAPARPRAALPPRRGQPAHGRRGGDQQGRHGRPGRRRRGARQRPAGQPRRRDRRGGHARSSWTTRPRSAASACWWSRTAPR